MSFKDLAAKRFSCKKYADIPVKEDELTYVLETARLAPTAKNAQPQHIYVLQSTEALAKMDSLTPCRYGAPVALLVAYKKGLVFHYPGGTYDSGAEDMGIVGTHLTLAAAEAGLDSCWVNNFDPDRAHKVFGLPEDEVAVLFLDLGHAAEGVKSLPNHAKRKPLDETVTYL